MSSFCSFSFLIEFVFVLSIVHCQLSDRQAKKRWFVLVNDYSGWTRSLSSTRCNVRPDVRSPSDLQREF